MPALLFSFNVAEHDGKFWAVCNEDGNLGVSSVKRNMLPAIAAQKIKRRHRQCIIQLIENHNSVREGCDFAYAVIPLQEAKEALGRVYGTAGV